MLAGHETMHVLQNQYPDLYADLRNALDSDIIGFDKYLGERLSWSY